jgi:enamine deaminase RidA (YjgF/YER057c/UK114 family)
MSERIFSNARWEEEYGYARAVVVDGHVYVSGCTAYVDGVMRHQGDPYQQTLTAFGAAQHALEEAGFALEDVVRTRMYVVHARDTADVGRAHGELFADIRPAATMLIVAGLIEPDMLVEVEVDAHRETPKDTR